MGHIEKLTKKMKNTKITSSTCMQGFRNPAAILKKSKGKIFFTQLLYTIRDGQDQQSDLKKHGVQDHVFDFEAY